MRFEINVKGNLITKTIFVYINVIKFYKNKQFLQSVLAIALKYRLSLMLIPNLIINTHLNNFYTGKVKFIENKDDVNNPIVIGLFRTLVSFYN